MLKIFGIIMFVILMMGIPSAVFAGVIVNSQNEAVLIVPTASRMQS
jgi:hypothetical protein